MDVEIIQQIYVLIQYCTIMSNEQRWALAPEI